MRQELNKFKKSWEKTRRRKYSNPATFHAYFDLLLILFWTVWLPFSSLFRGKVTIIPTAVKLQFLILTLFMSDRPLTPTECTYDICAYPALQITRPTEEKPQHFFCLSVTLSCSILLCIAETSDEWLGSCSFNVSSASVIQVSRTSRFLAKVW